MNKRRAIAALALCICASSVGSGELVFQGDGQVLAVEVIQADPIFANGQSSVELKLDQGSSEDFAELTTLMIGKKLSLMLCGKELLRPIVRERLEAGRAVINMPDIQHAIAVAEILRGEADCSRLEGLFVD